MTSQSSDASTRRVSLLAASCIVVANMVGTGVFTSLGFQVGDLPRGVDIRKKTEIRGCGWGRG